MQGAEPRQSGQIITAGPEDNRTISVHSQEEGGIQDYADQREFLQGEHWIKKLVQKILDLPPYVKYLLLPMSGLIATAAIVIMVNPAILPAIGHYGNRASYSTPPPPILNPAKLYALSAKVAPEGGGLIRITPPSESGAFESGITIRLTAIPDECYTFSYWEGVTSESSEATITIDSNKSITANFRLKDATPPTISEVQVPSYSDTSATITWNTDKPAKGQVEYNKTEAYGLSTRLGEEFTTSHKIQLTGLEPNTTYYFKVMSKDKCGDEANSVTGKLKTSDIIPVGYEIGKRPPDFTLQEYQDNRNPESPNNGETVSLSDYRGKKILLNFWNTFCGACIGEFPGIRKIYEDAKWTNKNNQDSGLVVLTVCIDGRADRIEKLEDKYQDAEDKYFGTVGRFTFPILLDVEEKTSKDYHIFNIPCSFFIDRDGIIRDIKFGRFTSLEEIQSEFDSIQ